MFEPDRLSRDPQDVAYRERFTTPRGDAPAGGKADPLPPVDFPENEAEKLRGKFTGPDEVFPRFFDVSFYIHQRTTYERDL